MGVFGLLGGLVQGLFGFIGGLDQAARQRKAASDSANSLYKKAYFIENRTQQEIENYDRSVNQLQSTLKARVGASGIRLSGSALAVLHSNAVTAERNRRVIAETGHYESENLRSEAQQVLDSGEAAASSATSAGLGSLFGGVAKAGESFYANKSTLPRVGGLKGNG